MCVLHFWVCSFVWTWILSFLFSCSLAGIFPLFIICLFRFIFKESFKILNSKYKNTTSHPQCQQLRLPRSNWTSTYKKVVTSMEKLGLLDHNKHQKSIHYFLITLLFKIKNYLLKRLKHIFESWYNEIYKVLHFISIVVIWKKWIYICVYETYVYIYTFICVGAQNCTTSLSWDHIGDLGPCNKLLYKSIKVSNFFLQ